MINHHRTFLAALLAGSALLSFTTGTQAQTIYRIVGADGKVTFSDKPPASADQGKIAGTGVGAAGAAGNTSLPFELRQVASKYPVTLYTSAECAPCGAGRALLSSRGVPFNERTVSTAEDAAALQRLSGENSLPFLTIGSQRIKGYSDSEWVQYLDAAGYPKTSVLPAGFRNAPAAPLVTVQRAPTRAEEKPPAPAETTPVDSGPGPSNPAGITF
ncbi:glutaredoxin domain-containing protein [Rhodoferax saidenbachensis]|uniref:glutaredoxin domain-containing protein n=1 Tax=Rhodoferax saidenbachensis TaxID=1484693 RepID=UPI0004A39484|nr:glutaredoxin domain-containing protein [Rhodoferax saidenbachensis]